MRALLQTMPIVLALCAGVAHAQLYKWVGPDGKITYSDTPPPPAAARVETRPGSTGAASAGDLPYELAQAARNHPVTLYTTVNCTPCDDGRKLLTERGIPFAEKTVTTNDDINQFRQVAGDGNFPLLTVGRTRERGFEATAWNNALTLAGYPASSRLPRTYRNPPAQAVAPRSEPPQAAQNDAPAPAVAPPPTDTPRAIGNAPPGFRF